MDDIPTYRCIFFDQKPNQAHIVVSEPSWFNYYQGKCSCGGWLEKVPQTPKEEPDEEA